jgi:hypothetical protein
MLPWDAPVDADNAEEWLFPSMSGPEAKPGVARGRRKANGATAPAEPDTAPETTDRPPGLRGRRSAFAAARAGQ